MQIRVAIVALLVLAGCGNKAAPSRGTVTFKDKSQYSKAFVEALESGPGPWRIQVIDDHVIVDNDDYTFPNELALNKAYVFTAAVDARSVRLTVTRNSHTTVRYELELRENETVTLADMGQAGLDPLFFLANAFNVQDEQTGTFYGGYVYRIEDAGCSFSLGIGRGMDEQGRLRARLNRSCNAPSRDTPNLPDVTLRSDIVTAARTNEQN
jgi:hypothetical protein